VHEKRKEKAFSAYLALALYLSAFWRMMEVILASYLTPSPYTPSSRCQRTEFVYVGGLWWSICRREFGRIFCTLMPWLVSIGWRFSGNEGGSTICVNAQAYWKGERWEEAKIRRDEIETHPWGRNNAKEAGADPFDFICGLPVICK
jgi:hypothetical protein